MTRSSGLRRRRRDSLLLLLLLLLLIPCCCYLVPNYDGGVAVAVVLIRSLLVRSPEGVRTEEAE